MVGHWEHGYEELCAQGWLAWAEVEKRVGQAERNLPRWARLLRETHIWPANIPGPETFPIKGKGGSALYHPDAASFLRDALVLHPFAHFRGQRHSIGRKTRPLAPLRLLLAARGWQYDVEVIRRDVVAAIEQFRALTGDTWSSDHFGAWLFTGKVTRERGKRSAYWTSKVSALMAWLSLLAGRPIRGDVWNGQRHLPPWSRIIRSIEQADHAVLKAWITTFRPLVDAWCFSPPQPRTVDEILTKLSEPPLPVDEIRRDNVATRVFRLLNRGLEDAYWTRPGDVDRWEQTRKNQGYQLPEPAAMWRRGRLYEVGTGKVRFTIPKDRSLYYPDNLGEVVARLFKYAGVFVALGVATHDPARTDPVAPLPEGRPLPKPWGLCRFCDVPLRGEVIGTQPRVWCPKCFTEVNELAGVLSRWDDDTKAWRMIVPSG